MQRTPCPDAVLNQLFEYTAKRLAELMESDPELSAAPDKLRALQTRSGVGKTTIRAVLSGKRASQTNTLMKLAWTFNVPVWQLLHPPDDQTRVFEPKPPSAAAITSGREVAAGGPRGRDLKSR